MTETHLTRATPLPFEIKLVDGMTVTTIGDAEKFISDLSPVRRDQSHWIIAIRMMGIALKEPTYLQAATLSFQTAVMLDGQLLEMHG